MSALDGFYSTWNKARETFGVGTPVDGSGHDGSSQLMRMKGMIESAAPDHRWQGSGSEAYAAANKEHAGVYEKLAALDKKMAAEVTNAANIVTSGRQQLDATKSWVDSAVNSLPASLSSDAREKSLIPIAKEGIGQVNKTVSTANGDMLKVGFRITDIKNQYDELGTNQKFGPDKEDEKDNELLGFKENPPSTDDARRRNQIEAFKNTFGRDPTSKSDWSTAAALDPHTYNPAYAGTNSENTKSEVRVVKIRPVPGEGVVRVSQWIEQRDVTSFPPYKRDMGNNRSADANFDPEDTKVTTYIDYENGVVIMRQNPSVELNADGSPGRVEVGSPQGSVTQTADGAVRIKYDAGNPFAPQITADPQGPFADHTVTVNGDLVFTPGVDGVQVAGTRTDYPSMEVYQDFPNGNTKTILIDPAVSGRSHGPAVNLPFHHDVGIGGGQAFKPFDTGSWNPRYDVPAPLPATQFGPAIAPPAVPPPPTGGGVPM
ncbi:EspA/EspE family type VII secretion system effector [[Mycobacterium] fortunisiensis]|uniref:EspA/EspE family type VII secretion system effector n=1 Tax=[Mycobacterium] fortunisiensis TaxID=2600579 RepID=UPI0027DF262E|nr:EspA/EspE family type VII secretion system effector [[Mycobacterium] fortunisiensis]